MSESQSTHKVYFKTGEGIRDVHEAECECPVGADHYAEPRQVRATINLAKGKRP